MNVDEANEVCQEISKYGSLSLPATLETGVTLCMYIPTIYSETGTEYIFFQQFSCTYKLNIP